MAYTILYPDAKPQQLDIETKAVGPEVTLLNPRQNKFEAIELERWQTCDAMVVSRMPIDRNVVAHLKRCRIVVRNGVGFDVLDFEGPGRGRHSRVQHPGLRHHRGRG